eukprot:SAG31_NODE_1263_length_9072_cov_9.389390_2_plen_88_part_00
MATKGSFKRRQLDAKQTAVGTRYTVTFSAFPGPSRRHLPAQKSEQSQYDCAMVLDTAWQCTVATRAQTQRSLVLTISPALPPRRAVG